MIEWSGPPHTDTAGWEHTADQSSVATEILAFKKWKINPCLKTTKIKWR